MIEWIILQLLSYGPLDWLLLIGIAFLASFVGGVVAGLASFLVGVVAGEIGWRWKERDIIAFLASFFGGVVGMFGGHFLVAAVILILDINYATTHEYMDMDIVFTLGVLMRVLLINTVLLPVSFSGLSLSSLFLLSFFRLWPKKRREDRSLQTPSKEP